MNKTKSQKYNENLDKIFQPEIDRLKKREEVASKILDKLEEVVNFDYCGLDDWNLIDIIGKVINSYIK